MNTKIAVIILVVAAALMGLYVYAFGFPEDRPREETACTLEAKLCPDGSAVGRTGPNCEFAPCPGESGGGDGNIFRYQSGIRGVVFLGPTCPVVMDPPDPECADRKYETTLALTTPDGARVVQEFNSDAQGRFSIGAAPGEYGIRSAVAANVLPYCSTNETVRVFSGTYTETTVYCDTGIR